MKFSPLPGPSTNAITAVVNRRSDVCASVRATSAHFLSIRSTASRTTSVLTAVPVAYAPCMPCVYEEPGKKSLGTNRACASSRDLAARMP